MYGGIMFSPGDDFGGLFVYKNHVSFEFGNGAKFVAPHKNCWKVQENCGAI